MKTTAKLPAKKNAKNAKKINKAQSGPKQSIYERITEQVLNQLAKGVVPWKRPWKTLLDGAPEVPRNYVSKKAYRGINMMLLSCNNHERPYYVTFNQAKELGGSVKKGAKGNLILFYKIEHRERDGENVKTFFERPSWVFNIEDVEGVEFKLPELNSSVTDDDQKLARCEKIVSAYIDAPEIKLIDPARAYYCIYKTGEEYINMPLRKAFKTIDEYYKVLFHEMAHSTGHPNRLNRPEMCDRKPSDKDAYDREELTAEMTAGFLAAMGGLNMSEESGLFQQTASYINSYLKAFEMDKQIFYTAARQAQKASDYILGTGWQTIGDEDEPDAE